MPRPPRYLPKASSPIDGAVAGACVLPCLATAEQLGRVLQVSSRTIHLWAAAGKIPVALRQNKVVRFHPPSVASALGLTLPEFGSARDAPLPPTAQ